MDLAISELIWLKIRRILALRIFPWRGKIFNGQEQPCCEIRQSSSLASCLTVRPMIVYLGQRSLT